MLFQIFSHTPIWVFVLFFVLLGMGIQQGRDRNVSGKIVFILPACMILFSCFGLISSTGASGYSLAIWIGSVLGVASLGWRFDAADVRYHSNVYSIPGSWLPLMLMMGIFFTKYAVGVMSALRPEMIEQLWFIYSISFIYGIFSGAFAARAIWIWKSGRRLTLTS